MKTLLLWDIDGTLICSGGAGERALLLALKREFGLDGSLDGIDYAGRTDAWIAREILTRHGRPATAESIRRYLEAYLDFLAAGIANPQARLQPGVSALLETIRGRGDIAQGLLTGNLARGARLKLEHFDVWRYFEFGAFADDSPRRNDLGPHALRRAREHHRAEFPADRVFVIGDTPHDIECGRVIGARTIAVATGRYSLAELRACEPTAAFADFGDPAAFLRVLGAG